MMVRLTEPVTGSAPSGPWSVRAYLDELLPEVWSGAINPGKVFDLELGLEDAGEAYRAMDERRSIKTLLRP